MKASNSLPVEIWQKILQAAVCFDEFLNPETFAGNFRVYDRRTEGPYSDAKEAWQVEKERMKLTLVCNSWRDFLHGSEHRLVRMEDIFDGHLEQASLHKAIRLDFCLYERRSDKGYLDFVRTTLYQLNSDAVAEILDFGDLDLPLRWLFSARAHFPRVGALIMMSCRSEENLSEIIRDLPNLRHVYARGFYWIEESIFIRHDESLFSDDNPRTLSLSKLVMLAICPRTTLERSMRRLEWNTPSLRHLRIIGGRLLGNVDFISVKVPLILRGVGASLRSLHLIRGEDTGELPDDIWDLCPSINVLHTDFKPLSSPPPAHPIRHVTLGRPSMVHDFKLVSAWDNVRYVKLAIRWGSMPGEIIDAARMWMQERKPIGGKVVDRDERTPPGLK